jgi:UDP-N-acetylglucosamine 2-epimerase
MSRYERLLLETPSNLCLVVCDVASNMACAIAAQKLYVPVAHVEAGIRASDCTMPEKINRMVPDSITNWFFTTSEVAMKLIWLQLRKVTKDWKMAARGWHTARVQFALMFGDRFEAYS